MVPRHTALPVEASIARHTERLLNGAAPPARRFETLNAGVQGYNTRDEVLYLEHHWIGFDPDLVLIVFYINDAYADSTILNNGSQVAIGTTLNSLRALNVLGNNNGVWAEAGTAVKGDNIVTNGGRVLGVTALGKTVVEAQALAYEAVEKISFEGAYCRKDIADKAIKKH